MSVPSNLWPLLIRAPRLLSAQNPAAFQRHPLLHGFLYQNRLCFAQAPDVPDHLLHQLHVDAREYYFRQSCAIRDRHLFFKIDKIRSNSPFLHHRLYRLYAVFHDPYSGGMSRHGAPVRIIQQTASMNRRLLLAGRPPFSRSGNNFSSFDHNVSSRTILAINLHPAEKNMAILYSIYGLGTRPRACPLNCVNSQNL